jgi:uncharacterized coiled-coil protein SlyX
MNADDDMPITFLTQITEVLEKHTEILAEHRKYLERLFEEVTAVKKKVESLEEKPLDSSDVEFLKTVSARLQAISTSIDAQR